MIPEHQDRARVVHLFIGAHELLEEDRRHGRDVFMAEADVGDDEPFVARLHCGDPHFPLRGVYNPVAGDDLFAQGHGTARRAWRREDHLSLESGDIEVEQAAVLDDATGDLAFARRERAQGDRLAPPHLVDDRKVGRGKHAQVLTVLAVDALDVVGDDELDPRAHLGVGGLLA